MHKLEQFLISMFSISRQAGSEGRKQRRDQGPMR